MHAVVIPLTAILAMQSVITMAAYSISVVIPVAAADLRIDPESVGYLVSVVYAVGMVAGLGSGALIARAGATHAFQLMSMLAAVGACVLWLTSPIAAIGAAVLFGFATGPMNPVGSHILARVTNVGNRALVFSIKQCGTPAGGMLAGVILPPLMLLVGWRWAMMIIPLLACVLVFLAPLGKLGGRETTVHDRHAMFRQVAQSLRAIIAEKSIRSLTLAGLCLATVQMGVTTYLVVYLWRELGFSEAAAGLVFAILHGSGIGARITLGFVADRLIAAKWVLVGICVLLSCSLAIMGQFTATWPVLIVYVVTALAGATGNGWVGLYFAELARLAPPTQVAEIAGGSQFFTYVGLVLGPLSFGFLLDATGSYAACFNVFAVVALLAGGYLARANARGG